MHIKDQSNESAIRGKARTWRTNLLQNKGQVWKEPQAMKVQNRAKLTGKQP